MQQTTPNPALGRLDVLVGEWDTAISFPGDPSGTARGHASFRWLEGGAFLVMRSEGPHTEIPRAVAIIGPDDAGGTYGMLYFDSRGVSRRYEMSLSAGVWKLWREAPDFSQRFTGTLSDGGDSIAARWEKSSDNSTWEHDFDLTYTKAKETTGPSVPE